MTMKVVSYAKKPIKRSNKRRRLRTVFRKFLNYMKSDTYMFSPLISPQSSATFSPASLGEGLGEPTKEQDKYLKCDCFMYAPMVLDSAVETTSAPTDFLLCTLGVHSQRKEDPSVRCDLIGKSSDETMLDIGNGMDSLRENVRDDCYPSMRRIAIKRALAPKERVKHAVHQNCRPMSVPGKGLFQKETHEIAIE
ncbi:uncharacterized protein LOC142530275 isoform X1 [Primulina tabacum]|uniref:uncharacterized protein LOC142530275 isoform X1 n=1 Tax=Primulina tabacum TaxID=48773 RepID=UPI003F599CE9